MGVGPPAVQRAGAGRGVGTERTGLGSGLEVGGRIEDLRAPGRSSQLEAKPSD